jgi:maltooligosyltrehalose trehalohydrolase
MPLTMPLTMHRTPHAPTPAAHLPAAQPGPDLWRLTYGARPLPDGATAFRVWAPRARRLEVVLPERAGRSVALREACEGVFEATVPGVPAGSDYAYRLDGGPLLPDPVSRWQPHGVHGPSRVVDPDAFRWSDDGWRGLPLRRLVFYELHVGTFSPPGTFDAAIGRLDYLVDLGITAVELMPVAEFPGPRNWGYDGAHLYAPQHSYGGPEGLKRLVDACHARGLAAILDVVYNHLGPEGNYLGQFGPYFSQRYRTPWGEALNFDDRDCDPVRRHFVDNALYWLTEYHLDGLRLDAIHGIYDFGARHVLAELSAAFHAQARRLGRLAWLVAESDLNDTRVIEPRELGGWGLDAQWSDDFHHAQHALLTGARHGYFVDFGRVGHLCKALERGFVNDGGWSPYRRRRHGNSSLARPGEQLVVATQNHDQVANASRGQRLGTLTDPEREKLAAALLLCAPNLPLLFMGQEFGALTPFHFFTSHGDAGLAKAVTEGRRAEMAALQNGADFADPQAEATFAACRLDWDCLAQPRHAGLLAFYRDLLALRRAHACLHNADKERTRATGHEARRWLVLQREDACGGGALLAANYGAEPVTVPLPLPQPPQTAAADAEGGRWACAIWSGATAYGGPGAPEPPATLAALPAAAGGELALGPWQAALYLKESEAS